jgi:hypothetical protein
MMRPREQDHSPVAGALYLSTRNHSGHAVTALHQDITR